MRFIKNSLISVAVALGVALVVAPSAQAESTFVSGVASPLVANARVDFRITVPRILYLRVGTGTDRATLATVDLIDFVVPAANVGDGTALNAEASSGDLGNGQVTARLLGNDGNITLSSTTLGPLTSAGAATISYDQIDTATAVLTSATALPAPALVDAATTTTTVTAVNNVVDRDAVWTYTYLNDDVVPAGTYGGVNTNNGRVTYTASML